MTFNFMNTSNKNTINIDMTLHIFNSHVHEHFDVLQHFRINHQ